MKVLIENQQTKVEFTDSIDKLLLDTVNSALAQECFDMPAEVSILLVDDEKIREINKEYRDIDKSTDVLSFPIVDMHEGEILSDEGDIDMDDNMLLLGDIIISMETAVKQAAEYGHSLERELAFLTCHGVFHLIGYDHMNSEDEKKMMGKQEKLLEQMGLPRKDS
jgi:probable rRNA maturation factor